MRRKQHPSSCPKLIRESTTVTFPVLDRLGRSTPSSVVPTVYTSSLVRGRLVTVTEAGSPRVSERGTPRLAGAPPPIKIVSLNLAREVLKVGVHL